ncbi:hypothetical protein CZP2022_139 [Vibrio phage C-ZP2022]|nr:hypothetical protein CZP2022_139 [Vibrio phage C-ZP2022]
MKTKLISVKDAVVNFVTVTVPNFFRDLWTKFIGLFSKEDSAEKADAKAEKQKAAIAKIKEALPEVKEEAIKDAEKAEIYVAVYVQLKNKETLTDEEVCAYRKAIVDLYKHMSDKEMLDKISAEVEADIKNKTAKK